MTLNIHPEEEVNLETFISKFVTATENIFYFYHKKATDLTFCRISEMILMDSKNVVVQAIPSGKGLWSDALLQYLEEPDHEDIVKSHPEMIIISDKYPKVYYAHSHVS